MVKLKLTPIAESKGVPILVPNGTRVSLFNSPYPAHWRGTAMDIYYPEVAISPVDGKVTLVRAFKPPAKTQFAASRVDYLVGIQVARNLTARILHVKPIVNVGETIRAGEEIGAFLRSGFFDFWTDPHVHLEFREGDDLLRPTNSLPLRLLLAGKKARRVPWELKGKVIESKPEYCLVSVSSAGVGHLNGLPVKCGSFYGVLDGGFPHYKKGGIIGETYGRKMWIGKTLIGWKTEKLNNMAAVSFAPLKVLANSTAVRGLSCYLGVNCAVPLKLVPERMGDLSFPERATVKIELREA